jgi:hypothetical protein
MPLRHTLPGPTDMGYGSKAKTKMVGAVKVKHGEKESIKTQNKTKIKTEEHRAELEFGGS